MPENRAPGANLVLGRSPVKSQRASFAGGQDVRALVSYGLTNMTVNTAPTETSPPKYGLAPFPFRFPLANRFPHLGQPSFESQKIYGGWHGLPLRRPDRRDLQLLRLRPFCECAAQ
jgi:hypothetical protein